MITLPPPLDSLLKEIEPGTITNFFGGPGTGKTNLCLLAAISCINSGGGRVVYIDTEGGFSLERLKQIANDCEAILQNIELVEPKDFSAQAETIKNLAKKSADLVILDSAVALYRIVYSDTEQKKSREINPHILEANRELSKQLSVLSNYAREKRIPVVITAHTFKNWSTGADEIVGGETMKYWSKAVIFLEKTGRTSERKAVVTKHRHMEEGKSVKFLIVQEGIKPSGFKLF